MKRLVEYLPFIVLGLAGCIIVAAILEHREAKREETVAVLQAKPMEATAPEGESQTSEDRGLTHEVYNDPAKLDAQPSEKADVVAVNGEFSAVRPKSEAVLGGVSSGSSGGPTFIEGDDLEAFASLRSDALRNPESEQNRIAAESIMRKRNRRIKQLGLK